MHRIRKSLSLKILALTVAINLFVPHFSPLFAITSGPTVPEVESFEPFDVTDMVQPSTGDFTYSVPLTEVSGPEGGYPLSLSYHAGARVKQEASWIGLGWNLNPGAITRGVSAYPDDHLNVERVVHDYWRGGRTKTFGVGVGFGLGPARISAELLYGHDTYRGSGVGATVGIGVNMGAVNIGINYTKANGILKDRSGFSASLGVSGQQGDMNYGLQASTDFSNGVNYSASIGMSQDGISSNLNISENGISPSFSMGVGMDSKGKDKGKWGAVSIRASTNNRKKGRIRKKSRSFGVAFIVSVSYSKVRYWMDEHDQTDTYGVLHAREAGQAFDIQGQDGKVAMDMAQLPDPCTDGNNCADATRLASDDNDPEMMTGGSLPEFDNYQVNAQGIAGRIKPYIFENISLFKKGSVFGKKSTYKRHVSASKKAGFRFVGDFSNSHSLSSGSSVRFTSAGTTDLNRTYLANYRVSPTPSDGISATSSDKKEVVGSRHIRWYTNQEVLDDMSIIDNTNLPEEDRISVMGRDVSQQIGGFSITKEDGLTYHFSQPVYSYDEYIEHNFKDQTKGQTFNKQWNYHPYAYAWYLTGITGPDFVDRNGNGMTDESDWGYWVAFDYGKWTDHYAWRTPESGAIEDENKLSFSYGKKQLYYLDAVRTRTHTALFEKEIKYDGRGVSSKAGGFSPTSVDENPFENIDKDYEFRLRATYADANGQVLTEIIRTSGSVLQQQYKAIPVPKLALKKIYLFKNDDLNSTINNLRSQDNGQESLQLKTTSSSIANNYLWSGSTLHDLITEYKEMKSGRDNELEFKERGKRITIRSGRFPQYFTVDRLVTLDLLNVGRTGYRVISYPIRDTWEMDKLAGLTVLPKESPLYESRNVISNGDISSSLVSKAIKEISLDQDYSLCPKVPNTLESTLSQYELDNYSISTLRNRLQNRGGGKLTLNAINFKNNHKGNMHNMLPPLKFYYDLEEATYNYARVEGYSANEITLNRTGLEGKLVKFTEKANVPIYGDRGSYMGTEYREKEHYALLESSLPSNSKKYKYVLLEQNASRLYGPDLGVLNNRVYFTDNPPYHPYKYDSWGFYKPDFTGNHQTNDASRIPTVCSSGQKDVWSLKRITSPMGTLIDIHYESDKIGKVALAKSHFSYLNIDKMTYQRQGDGILHEEYNVTFHETVNPREMAIFHPGQDIYLDLLIRNRQFDYVAFGEFHSVVKQVTENSLVLDIDMTCREPNYTVSSHPDWDNKFPGSLLQLTDMTKSGRDTDKVVSGFLQLNEEQGFPMYGGGLRVSSIQMSGSGRKKTTTYDYSANAYDGGVTSYLPQGVGFILDDQEEGVTPNLMHKEYQKWSHLYTLSRFVPGPEVMYPTVSVRTDGEVQGVRGSDLGHITYDFITFDPDRHIQYEKTAEGSSYAGHKRILKVNLGSVGQLKRMAHYNGQGHLISETTNEYLDCLNGDCGQYGNQGVIHQEFHDVHTVTKDNKTSLYAGSYGLYEYPTVMTSSTTKTGGITTTVSNEEFDFYNGLPSKVKTTSSDGFYSLEETDYAYHHYPRMGLKVNAASNFNMLSQVAGQRTYSLDRKGQKVGLIGATATVWSDDPSYPTLNSDRSNRRTRYWNTVPRQAESWVFVGDQDATGLVPPSNFNSFDYTSPSRSTNWERSSVTHLFSPNSKPLEIYNQKSKTYDVVKYNASDEVILLKAKNARFEEVAFMGAEQGTTGANGEFRLFGGGRSSQYAHTGENSMLFNTTSSHCLEWISHQLPRGKTYQVKAWARANSTTDLYCQVLRNNSNLVVQKETTMKAGDWTLFTFTFKTPTNLLLNDKIKVRLGANQRVHWVDDVRIAPLHASANCFVYDNRDRLIFSLGEDHTYTQYVYGKRGHLQSLIHESPDVKSGKKKVKEYIYHYQREM